MGYRSEAVALSAELATKLKQLISVYDGKYILANKLKKRELVPPSKMGFKGHDMKFVLKEDDSLGMRD